MEQEPQDPSLSEHITCLLARQSWVPPKLPLNTPAVTKDVYEFTAEEQQVAKEKYAALLASNLEEADLLSTADMLSALSPNTAAVAIKIPLRNLSQLLSRPACLTRVTEAADPNFSLEKFRTTMLVVALRPVAQFFTRRLQQLKELKSVKEHHASLMMLIDPAFWESVLLDAMQHFQNTALCRARLAHVYTVGEGHDQRIDRWYVETHKYGKVPPSRISGQDANYTHFPPHLERATMEAIHNSLRVSHVWIAKFFKLPKDTVGSFIMTFHTDAVGRGPCWRANQPGGGPAVHAKLAVKLSSQWVGWAFFRA